MSVEQIYALGGVVLIAMSLALLVGVSHLLRKLLAFNIMASGVFLVIVGLGQNGGDADAVPQALVLTGIVVSFASTALALVLLRRWFTLSGHLSFEEEHEAKAEAADERGEH